MKASYYIYAVLLIVVVCLAVYLLLPAYTEYTQTRDETRTLQTEVNEVGLKAEELEEDIHALRTDPKAIERVAREKFGWCKENEKIYHFDPAPATENKGEP
jgi:cell division protein FtsB